MASIAEKEMRHAVEFIPDRLYYVALSSVPAGHSQRHYFSIDKDMVYWNFYLDFGPLNLGHLYRFCQLLNNKLADNKLKDKVIYYYSHTHAHKRANAAFLICSWFLLNHNKTPEEAFRPFKNYPAPFPPWHDATPSICTFNLTILDTLKGLAKAREHRFFDFSRFNIEEYEHYEQVENGDLNWYVEGRFLGFAGPHAEREASPGGYYTLRPEDYISYFKRKNVTLVVRLNKSYYDPKRFTSQGIDHCDMYFLDGSNPPEHILQKFIAKCEETTGGIAVHCKAGLGRTGTCIACYIMKHYRLTAEEIIGWMRIARPGSVIGPQQNFLKEMQNRMWREGEVYRSRLQQPALPSLPSAKEETTTAGRLGSARTGSAGQHSHRELSSSSTAGGGGSGGGVGTGTEATTGVLTTPSLGSRFSRMAVSSSPVSGIASPPSSSMTPPARSLGGVASGTGTSGKHSSPTPQSPGFFDVRPSSSPRSHAAMSSYFRSPAATPSPSTSLGMSAGGSRGLTSASSSGRGGAGTTAASSHAADIKDEEEGGTTQGDLLRARRQMHLHTPTGLSGSGGGASTPGGDTPPPSTTPQAKSRSSRSSFNFLSSWKA